MFSLDNQQLNRLRLVQALAEALGADDSPIAEMLTEAGYTTTDRACQLAAQSMVLTFEAHSLGELSAPSAPPAVRVKHPKPSTANAGGGQLPARTVARPAHRVASPSTPTLARITPPTNNA